MTAGSLNARLLELPTPGSDCIAHQPETLFEQLIAFYAAYTRAASGDPISAWPAFLAEDCLYWVTSQAELAKQRPQPLMLCDKRVAACDRVAMIEDAQVFRGRQVRIKIFNLRITGEAPGRVFTVADLEATQTLENKELPEIILAGSCQDEIVLQSGAPLLFQRRAVILDHSVIRGELVFPL